MLESRGGEVVWQFNVNTSINDRRTLILQVKENLCEDYEVTSLKTSHILNIFQRLHMKRVNCNGQSGSKYS